MITGSNSEGSDKCRIDKHPDYITVMYRAACVRYSCTWLGGKQFPLHYSLATASVGNVCGDSLPIPNNIHHRNLGPNSRIYKSYKIIDV